MKVEGTYRFDADRDTVWSMLLDPEALGGCIPGCEELRRTDVDSYDVVLKVGVGAVRGTYTGRVAITEKEHPSSFKMVVEGKGRGGTVTGTGVLRLADLGGTTELSVAGDARVTGVVARVG
jgi:carbon monoxide dehydrogenase subunit G